VVAPTLISIEYRLVESGNSRKDKKIIIIYSFFIIYYSPFYIWKILLIKIAFGKYP